MKRCFDILISMSALILLAIPLLAMMSLVRLNSPGPSLYWSKRVGRNGQIFEMPKLRTMAVHTPVMPTHEMQNAESYVTSVGKFLRRSSLDETPQLYSVLIGHMSIVGPRPMIPEYKELIFCRQEAGVDRLRPGITGWAQVNGRDMISTDEKLALDVEYLQRKSLRFDLYILYRTVIYVFSGYGIWH